MNQSYVFMHRLGQYFQKNKLIFLLYIIGGILNTVLVLYCYGNLLPSVANRNSQEMPYRAYSVSFDQTFAKMSDIQKLAGSPLVESFVYMDSNRVGVYNGNYPMITLSGTTTFRSTWEIIVPPNSEASVGDTVELYGKNFLVIGVSSNNTSAYFIPAEAFADLGCDKTISKIYFYSSQRQTPSVDKSISLINEIFPYRKSLGGDAYLNSMTDQINTKPMALIVGITALAAVVAQTFLLHNVLTSMRGENVISIIVGASRWQIITFTVREVFFLSLTSNGLGILSHIVLYDILFTRLNLSESIVYGVMDYCIIFAFMLLISLLVAVPVITKETGIAPAAAKNRAM